MDGIKHEGDICESFVWGLHVSAEGACIDSVAFWVMKLVVAYQMLPICFQSHGYGMVGWFDLTKDVGLVLFDLLVFDFACVCVFVFVFLCLGTLFNRV